MTGYFSKVWDGLDMIWASFSFLERYYTVVALLWVLAIIIRLMIRSRREEEPVPVRVVNLPGPQES